MSDAHQTDRSFLALASFVARPSAILGTAQCEALVDASVKPFLGNPCWRALVDDHLNEQLKLRELPTGDLSRSDPYLALALMPVAVLERAVKQLSAAIHQSAIRRLVLRSDRLAWREDLGAEAIEFGLRQAPTFYPALSGFSPATITRRIDAGERLLLRAAQEDSHCAWRILKLRFGSDGTVSEAALPNAAKVQLNRFMAREMKL